MPVLKLLGEYLYGCAVTALVVLTVYVIVNREMPVPPAPSCSCEGKEDCETQVFKMVNGNLASCALWGERKSCCAVEIRN